MRLMDAWPTLRSAATDLTGQRRIEPLVISDRAQLRVSLPRAN
jgi:hypothetical protein